MATLGVFHNYAMKATFVEYLALNLATEPVAPYFDCYAVEENSCLTR
jgi:hypothetical protein